MESKDAGGLVCQVQGGLPRADGIRHAAQQLGGEAVERDSRRQVGRERPPLLAVVVLVRVEMGADIPLEPPAQALRQRKGRETHHGNEDDQGAQERRLGNPQLVQEPSGRAGKEKIETAQADHDGPVDEVPGDRQVGAEGARTEEPDRDEKLANDQGDRSDEKALPIQPVKEQGLAEQVEPDDKDTPQAQGQILEPPPDGAV